MGTALSDANVDFILVGDCGTTIGYETTVPVTMDDMLRHTAAVRRSKPKCLWLPTCHLVKPVCLSIVS